MTKKAKPNLAAAVAKMQEPAPAVSASRMRPVEVANARPEIKQILIRVSAEAHKQLKFMAVDEGTELQALMIEAMNDLFIKRGKPPIA